MKIFSCLKQVLILKLKYKFDIIFRPVTSFICGIVITEPGPVTDIEFPDVQTTSLTISWTPPTGRVTDYNVRALHGETQQGRICDGSGNTARRTLCGLKAGSSYTFNVNAISGGVSGDSVQASQTLGK